MVVGLLPEVLEVMEGPVEAARDAASRMLLFGAKQYLHAGQRCALQGWNCTH